MTNCVRAYKPDCVAKSLLSLCCLIIFWSFLSVPDTTRSEVKLSNTETSVRQWGLGILSSTADVLTKASLTRHGNKLLLFFIDLIWKRSCKVENINVIYLMLNLSQHVLCNFALTALEVMVMQFLLILLTWQCQSVFMQYLRYGLKLLFLVDIPSSKLIICYVICNMFFLLVNYSKPNTDGWMHIWDIV